MPLEDRLHGPREEVLAVDAQPLDVASDEVDVALRVAVREVAGVVVAATLACGAGAVVLVVALEEAHAAGVDDLADRLLGIHEPPVLVEARGGTFRTVLVEDRDAAAGAAERAGRIAVLTREAHATLARAVGI